ncbi:MAG: AAA domain-containing protein [Candidatus Methanomethylophilaceae archaeon]|nr:AAA domain-containing protein [Candidatus Methanomethylophilaceae archaeon]
MDSDEALYKALIDKRNELREESKSLGGRRSTVCTDDACMEMVRLRPQKESDFEMIRGIGGTFMKRYAGEFLRVINEFNVRDGTTVNPVSMNESVECALQELEKKLVNISRNNRLLYMPKIPSAKESFDLFNISHRNDPLNALFGHKKVNLAKPGMRGADGKKSDHYNKLSQLYRNINRILRERGQNDLYVGYPFVEGCLPGDRFNVRAPLVLFPVELIRDPDTIDMRLDDSRDIIFNNTLILAYFKINRINKPLPDNTLDETKRDAFIDTVLSYYSDIGIRIRKKDDMPELSRFEGYLADQFPVYPIGEMYLTGNAVIGRFPTYSNSIQKDFDRIVEGQMVNPLLDDLLVSGNGEMKDTVKGGSINESELTYINDLNSAQEEVISAIRRTDRLVIQGPPGTGKSQTITNIIADFANEGKTVLMVSEKKAALDVVYSRLGRLSRYAMLIDDVNNKELFFRQMDEMTHLNRPEYRFDITSKDKSSEIEDRFGDLEYIARKIYEPCRFGIDPYRLYMTNRRIDPSDKDQLEKYTSYSEAFSSRLLDCGYEEINAIKERFKRTSTVTGMNDCLDMRAQHPWMMDVKQDLNEYDIEMAKNDMLALKEEIGKWRNSGFFSKILNKGKMKKRIYEVFERYWQYYRCNDIMGTYIEMDEYIRGLEYYDDFTTVNNVYESLSDHEKMYVDAMHRITSEEITSPNLVNEELYNFIILQHIQRFESENKEVLRDIASFENIERDLKEYMAQKKDISRNEIECRLSGYLSSITESKRYGEMLRVTELKRKWSVNKFVNKFDFELFKGIKIWLLTPDVVSEIIPMQPGLFDLVIFDEASQMFIEKGIPSIMRAKKVIIAGDHKQLRPSKLGAGRIGMDEDDAEDEGETPIYEDANSLLDVARFKYPTVMLNYHYRSKYEELISFSNHAFYKGRLYVSPNIESECEPPIKVHKLDDGKWKDRSNRAEAVKVVELISEIFKTRKDDETIGVITFNSTQMDLIDSLLEERCGTDPDFASSYMREIRRKDNGEDIGLFVKNIENVQGDERDIIIFSIGYAKGDNGKLVRNFGWLNQPGGENRLNVAISRAKKRIHIVTSFNPAELYVDDMKNNGPKLLKQYLRYCFAVSSGDKNSVRNILGSMNDTEDIENGTTLDDVFADRVYDALVKHGFDVERNVGIGGYSMDLAIRRGGRYVLGIECDGRLYHSDMNIRERDYHRRKYLESRGWNVYRVWSPNWWKNPSAEVEKIARIIDGSSEAVSRTSA